MRWSQIIIEIRTINYTSVWKKDRLSLVYYRYIIFAGGSLVDILKARNSAFDVETITKIFYQTCLAVAHMHSQQPKIIHRDLKIDNLLLSTDGFIKLCDFGSATCEIYNPDINWSANQHTNLEENVSFWIHLPNIQIFKYSNLVSLVNSYRGITFAVFDFFLNFNIRSYFWFSACKIHNSYVQSARNGWYME